jgi:dimethylargininase
LIRLEADERYPDSCFVEDAAVLSERQINGADDGVRVPARESAIITRPGALSRRGEVESIRRELSRLFPSIDEIQSPGTLDGGDVCQAGTHFFIGISERTNREGARQFADMLARGGFTHCLVDTSEISGLLHLNS